MPAGVPAGDGVELPFFWKELPFWKPETHSRGAEEMGSFALVAVTLGRALGFFAESDALPFFGLPS